MGEGQMFTFSHLQLSGMRSIHSTQKDFSYTNHGKIKTKIQIHSVVLTLYTILFKVLWPVKLLISIGQKVNSTYRLEVGNKENEKFEERKKMEFLGKKENRVVPRTFL